MKSTLSNILKEWLESILFAIIFSQIILLFFNPVIVSGNSMDTTLKDKQILINSKIPRYLNNFKNGDIVVVEADGKLLVKRIIASSGEKISIKNSKVYVNDNLLEEPYILEEMVYPYDIEIKLEEDQYFVMGDNRNNSKDSRYYGYFSKDDIKGKILFKK